MRFLHDHFEHLFFLGGWEYIQKYISYNGEFSQIIRVDKSSMQ